MIHEQKHHYGAQVHLLSSPSLEGWLADLCSPNSFQPRINHLVTRLYQNMLRYVIDEQLPKQAFSEPTRMTKTHPDVLLHGTRVARATRAISVNLARAGTYPSHLCYEALHDYLQPELIRQDHIFAARTTNENHQVTGTEFGASKIGGGQEAAYVFFPDPMGATGGTLVAAVDHYKKKVPGRAACYVALHLIVTPEYLRRVLTAHPDLQVYALRLDRGLSSEAVLESEPGLLWAQERGLNDSDYIVPGGGGFGEIMNNSFV
jgi:uracil phosphoribosyltransferase